jgi:hypothetical protein
MTENIADLINQARRPEGEMADLSAKAQRLRKALEIAEKWIDDADGDTEMWNRATIARDQLAEELARTAFEMDVLYNKRLIVAGRESRSGRTGTPLEPTSDEDRYRESRDSTLSDVLLDAYTTIDAAPLEVFGVGDRASSPLPRYVMMGALMAAVDATLGKQELRDPKGGPG